jgi:hypothetical protein
VVTQGFALGFHLSVRWADSNIDWTKSNLLKSAVVF